MAAHIRTGRRLVQAAGSWLKKAAYPQDFAVKMVAARKIYVSESGETP
jgi:hypothetical protein